jgi:hypothetical protein
MRRGLNSVAKETFSRTGAEKPPQAFSFAASREENLLSKFTPNCGCTPETKHDVFRGFHQLDFEHSQTWASSDHA